MTFPAPSTRFLPAAPAQYDRHLIQQILNALEDIEINSQKNDADIRIGTERRLVLTSPDGTEWSVTVNNSGTLTATAI